MAQENTTNHTQMRARTFEWVKQKMPDNTMKWGWKPVGTPDSFYPGRGHMVAHDTIEHVTNGSTWAHEMLAFGATLYGRAPVDRQMMQIVAEDFLGFSQDHDYAIPDLPARWDKPLPDVAEQQLHGLLEAISFIYNKDAIIHKIFGEGTHYAPITDERLSEVLHKAARWFRLGWRVQRRMFNNSDGREVFNLFDRVVKSVDAMTFSRNPKLGDRLTVKIDRTNKQYALEV